MQSNGFSADGWYVLLKLEGEGGEKYYARRLIGFLFAMGEMHAYAIAFPHRCVQINSRLHGFSGYVFKPNWDKSTMHLTKKDFDSAVAEAEATTI